MSSAKPKAPTEESASISLEQLRSLAQDLAEKMESFSSPDSRWLQYVFIAQDLSHFLQGTDTVPAGPSNLIPTPRQAQEFGRLVRDRRDAAGYSRVQLAQRTKLS